MITYPGLTTEARRLKEDQFWESYGNTESNGRVQVIQWENGKMANSKSKEEDNTKKEKKRGKKEKNKNV